MAKERWKYGKLKEPIVLPSAQIVTEYFLHPTRIITSKKSFSFLMCHSMTTNRYIITHTYYPRGAIRHMVVVWQGATCNRTEVGTATLLIKDIQSLLFT